MTYIHNLLDTISPEMTLISLVVAIIGVAPLFKRKVTPSQQATFSPTNSYYILVPKNIHDSRALNTTLWDRFWLSFFKGSASALDSMLSDGAEGFFVTVIVLAGAGWAATHKYNRIVATVMALILLLSIASVSVCLLFMRKVKIVPIGTYIKYLVTCFFSIVSIYLIYFGAHVNVEGLWQAVYYIFRIIGTSLAIIPALLASGAVIASVRQRDIEFYNEWKYLTLSFLSILLCADLVYELFCFLLSQFS